MLIYQNNQSCVPLWYSVNTLLLLPLGLLPRTQQVFTVALYIHIFINNMQLINGVFNIFPTIYTLLTQLYTSGGEQNGQYAFSANSLLATAAHHSLADLLFLLPRTFSQSLETRVRLQGAVHVSPTLVNVCTLLGPHTMVTCLCFLKPRSTGSL